MNPVQILWGLAVALLAIGPSLAAGLDKTTESAVYLLRASMNVEKDAGRADRMLTALGYLRDPQLAPFFENLAASDHGLLQIHGMLGLAECDQSKRIDLVRLSELERPAVQQRVVSVAMDRELLDLDQAKQLMGWTDLDPAVRAVVAVFLERRGAPADLAFLREASASEIVSLASWASLLLLQNGDPSAMAQLERLSQSNNPGRDAICQSLLRTAYLAKFDRVGPWAMKIIAAEGDSPLGQLALATALRFAAPGAPEKWQEWFAAESDLVAQMRVALIGLGVAPWVDPTLYEPLINADDATLQQIGKSGAAVAAKENIAEAVITAIELNQSQVTGWALNYAKEHATDEDARSIMLAVILAFDGPKQRQTQRLQYARWASNFLADRNPHEAAVLIRPILADPNTHRKLARGIVAGLAACRKTDPYDIIAGLRPFNNADAPTEGLALLIAARHGQALSPADVRDLSLLVRGGAGLSDDLRVQAAWAYLRHTGKTQLALAEVLGSSTPQVLEDQTP